MPRHNQTLLLDADDTLWENNVYFERAIAAFISFLNHQQYTPAEVRDILNQVERANVLQHGYGTQSFAHSLVATFEQLSAEPLTPALHETIHGFAHQIAEHPVEIIAGVPETLAYLAPRHRLVLVTKGNAAEQAGKVERSGLKPYFSAIEIVREKNVAVYRDLAARHNFHHQSTWMIGNSPKSDVNPALAAGLNAVFVPHADTWMLEHEEVGIPAPSGTLLKVESFAELQRHF
ncbi:MAG TPA: HAD family hydrolase [Terriglobales bacterium]|nr:HAD family hydrolase [Terriglobales bacterium]